MATTLIDFTGRRFGRLVVLERANAVGEGRPKWKCLCDCGSEKIVTGDDLRKPDGRATRSCGCLQREHMKKHAEHCKGKRGYHFVHGASGITVAKIQVWPEYYTWASMHQRCLNPNHQAFKHYGGRGITICARWHSFENFIADVGRRPPGLTLDRINNDGHYEPGNVRWATRAQQIANRRPRKKLAS